MGEAFQVHGSWKTEVRVQEPHQGEMFVRDKGEGLAGVGGASPGRCCPLGGTVREREGERGEEGRKRKRERIIYSEPQFPCLQNNCSVRVWGDCSGTPRRCQILDALIAIWYPSTLRIPGRPLSL